MAVTKKHPDDRSIFASRSRHAWIGKQHTIFACRTQELMPFILLNMKETITSKSHPLKKLSCLGNPLFSLCFKAEVVKLFEQNKKNKSIKGNSKILTTRPKMLTIPFVVHRSASSSRKTAQNDDRVIKTQRLVVSDVGQHEETNTGTEGGVDGGCLC